MKKFIFIFVFAISSIANAQSFTVFDIDTTNFPTIKAKFWAFDDVGNQMTNLSLTDIEITENGQKRDVTYISCPPKQTQKLSIVFAVDVTIYNDIDNAKNVLLAWLDMINLNKHEVAVMSYDGDSYLNQDFTHNKNKLTNSINSLITLSSYEDHTGALIRPNTGAVTIAAGGKYKPVVIVLSSCSHFTEEKKADIISAAQNSNTTINFVIFDKYDWTPQICRDISFSTGGFTKNKISYNDLETAKAAINEILQVNQNNGVPCTIEWTSGIVCNSNFISVYAKLVPQSVATNANYLAPFSAVAKLEFNPASVTFINPEIGVKVEKKVTVTAINTDFNVTNIIGNNPSFYITPTSFMLGKGESRELTVSYVPADSGYNICTFMIENDACKSKYYAIGGYKGVKPSTRTLKLLHPNGGEVFVAGSDTIITWEGIVPEEIVKIEYSTNNGINWLTIADSATGLSYKWRVPKTPSNQCLARITADAAISSYCEVKICEQIWMCYNLDVETYRNGDTIPQVTDPKVWERLTTGAWCYYDNDPAMGAIYGKLYNAYAVNDPRGLAPDGWHIPSSEEWAELINCLGNDSTAGGKLKSTGTIEAGDGLWKSPNEGATNESGFSAFPGGERNIDGSFSNISKYGFWWTNKESDKMGAWYLYLDHYSASTGIGVYDKALGYSVRCVKD